MKKRLFICLIAGLCQVACAKQNFNHCIGVVEKNIKTESIKNYFLDIQSNGTYVCEKHDADCAPMLLKDLTEISEDSNWAFIMHNNIEFLNNNGFYFDQYNIALGYAHSVFTEVFIAKHELNHDLIFDDNILTINFPKARQYEIGAYPRGILRPINHMFIQDKIVKIIIEKHQGKINKVTFTTDKNERFQYRLTYQENRLIQSEILFQQSPHSVWQVDTAVSYLYKSC